MKRCQVGGQAVLEGVMMKNPAGGVAMAVRKSDGSIVTEYTKTETKAKKGTFFGLPVVRGVVVFVETLTTGMQFTTRSAELFGEMEEEEPSKLEKWIAEKWNKSAMDVAIGVALVLAAALAVGLFIFLPSLASQLIPWKEGTPTVYKSLAEGGTRLIIFIGYILAISGMKDIRRLFMYHGAEHKTISCYEHEAALTPENAMDYSRLHPRCGTNYLFLVMAISIVFFAILPYSENFLLRLLTRILFLPLVAGISYEALKLAAASDNVIARAVRAPGMALQYLTTREPTPDMIEVAIRAFDLASDPEAAKEAEQAPAAPAETDPTSPEPAAPPSEAGAGESGNGTAQTESHVSGTEPAPETPAEADPTPPEPAAPNAAPTPPEAAAP